MDSSFGYHLHLSRWVTMASAIIVYFQTKGLTPWLSSSSKPSISSRHRPSPSFTLCSNPQVFSETFLQVRTIPLPPHLQRFHSPRLLILNSLRDFQEAWHDRLLPWPPSKTRVTLVWFFHFPHGSVWRLLEVYEEAHRLKPSRVPSTWAFTRHPCQGDREVLLKPAW